MDEIANGVGQSPRAKSALHAGEPKKGGVANDKIERLKLLGKLSGLRDFRRRSHIGPCGAMRVFKALDLGGIARQISPPPQASGHSLKREKWMGDASFGPIDH